MDISVIIPVYNSSSTVIESMDSVVRECGANQYLWELILVDDGSKDNSVELINQYIRDSEFADRINLICQTNGGAAVARNTGLKASKGKLVAFNDSDDCWLEGKLKKQIEYLINHTDVVMVAGIFGEDNVSIIKNISGATVITIKDQVFKNYFSPPTTMIRSAIFKKSGLFNEKMRHAEEGYFFNNIAFYGKSILIPEPFAKPITTKDRWGNSGLSGNLVKMEQGELFNIKSAYKLGYISFSVYLSAICFSIAKFCRRYIISKYRQLCK